MPIFKASIDLCSGIMAYSVSHYTFVVSENLELACG